MEKDFNAEASADADVKAGAYSPDIHVGVHETNANNRAEGLQPLSNVLPPHLHISRTQNTGVESDCSNDTRTNFGLKAESQ